MTAISKVVSLLAISVAVTLSGSHVFAKTGSSNGASQAKSSGTSAAPSGSGASGNQDKSKGCNGSKHCGGPPAKQPPPGATGGNDPNPNRGPGNPTLHPK
jgi:hypothetical protein